MVLDYHGASRGVNEIQIMRNMAKKVKSAKKDKEFTLCRLRFGANNPDIPSPFSSDRNKWQ